MGGKKSDGNVKKAGAVFQKPPPRSLLFRTMGFFDCAMLRLERQRMLHYSGLLRRYAPRNDGERKVLRCALLRNDVVGGDE